MRFMILVKASKDSEAGVLPTQEIFAAMADYHEQLVKAGVLLEDRDPPDVRAGGLRRQSRY
jgi:hypothetical protein